MQRINVQYFYLLASKLLPIKSLEAGSKIITVFSILYDAEREIMNFINNPFLPLTTSYQAATDLHSALSLLTNKPFKNPELDFEVELDQADTANLGHLLQCFEIVLQAEFSRRDIFAVSKKGLYSTTDLIENGEGMVSESAQKFAPDMVRDLHDAGRCVAFELSTAAAFHLFRAVESATMAYILKVRGTPVSKEEKRFGMGGYATLLKKKEYEVDERITHSIGQLTRLHRNPTIHPETPISAAEIIGTMGMAVSVIELIALDVERRTNTPGKLLSEVLPDVVITEEDMKALPNETH